MSIEDNFKALWRAVNNLQGRTESLETHEPKIWGCRVIRTSTQAVDTATLTPLSFNAEIYDTDGLWSSTAPTRMYAAIGGYYLAGGGYEIASGQNTAASRMLVAVQLSGGVYLAQSEAHTIANKAIGVSVVTGMFNMSTSDYVEIIAYHDEGSTKYLSAASSSASQHNNYGWLSKIG